MRLPFVSRRAFQDLGMAHSIVRGQLVRERDARRKAETGLTQERKKQRAVASWRYVDDGRLGRAVRALAAERAQAAAYRRTIRQLTDQLLDATGYQGEPLLPEARRVLDIDAKEADA